MKRYEIIFYDNEGYEVYYLKCNKCKNKYAISYNSDISDYNYCPICGRILED